MGRPPGQCGKTREKGLKGGVVGGSLQRGKIFERGGGKAINRTRTEEERPGLWGGSGL